MRNGRIRKRLVELKKRFRKEHFGKLFKMKLKEISYGKAVIKMRVQKEHTIIERFANGGILATLGNSAGVYAAMSRIISGHTMALNMSVFFIKPAQLESEIIAEANVISESTQYIWVEFNIYRACDYCSCKDNREALPKIVHGQIQYLKPQKQTAP